MALQCHVAISDSAESTRIRKYSQLFAQFLEVALDFLFAQVRADTKDLKWVVDLVVHLGASDLPTKVRKRGPADNDK